MGFDPDIELVIPELLFERQQFAAGLNDCSDLLMALVGFRGDGERAGSEPPVRGRISTCWS
jgi:hypothetical protein